MNLSPTAQATLLLTSYFSPPQDDSEKPLTNTEWGRFAVWLKNKDATPADLLSTQFHQLLEGWSDKKITLERLLALLARGHSLALAVEKWQRAGLWVITRSDDDYPKRLKSRLKNDAPPVLFGCGNKALLNIGGIAVIGSRNAGHEDLQFTHNLGTKAAYHGNGIVSGGARGVDETAMLATIKNGGNVIGVLADSLLKTATASKWRQGLIDGHLVLISPFYPEVGFNTGHAMARNKYIYCLADAALVVHSGLKGGTISGAEENLKKQWVPLWVKPSKDSSAGNSLLVDQGGFWCPETIDQVDLSSLTAISFSNSLKPTDNQDDLFNDWLPEPSAQLDIFSDSETRAELPTAKSTNTESNFNSEAHLLDSDNSTDFYQLFITELLRFTNTPKKSDEIELRTGLHKSQINQWLKQAINDGYVKKLSHPLRYQRIES